MFNKSNASYYTPQHPLMLRCCRLVSSPFSCFIWSSLFALFIPLSCYLFFSFSPSFYFVIVSLLSSTINSHFPPFSPFVSLLVHVNPFLPCPFLLPLLSFSFLSPLPYFFPSVPQHAIIFMFTLSTVLYILSSSSLSLLQPLRKPVHGFLTSYLVPSFTLTAFSLTTPRFLGHYSSAFNDLSPSSLLDRSLEPNFQLSL